MTKPKADALGPSGPGALAWWDGEVVQDMPDLAEELTGTVLQIDQFTEWLRGPLAVYRVTAAARASMAQKAAVTRWLESSAQHVDAALADGRLRRLPEWYAKPAVHFAALKAGLDWRAILASAEPQAVAAVLLAAAAALRRERVNRGRPPAVARDVLLHAVVEALKAAGLMPSEARHRADAILIKCRVPTPEESVARAARRGRGAISV